MKNGLSAFTAGILGLAVGDAFGMPYECGKRGEFDIYDETRSSDGRCEMHGFQPGMPAYFLQGAYAAGHLCASFWTALEGMEG